jgi:SAM-dependent methyltransferase
MDSSLSGKNLSSAEVDIAHPAPVRDRDFWDGRASEFSQYAASTGYPDRFIGLMDVDPDWTVLDMACGGGTLAIPLAGKVKSITAVDFSANMLGIVEKRCHEQGITNVRTVQGRWEDDWPSLGIGPHDVAIASRSLIANDVRASIGKLHSLATKQVYISTPVGIGPFDRRLFEASGRTFPVEHDYIYFYNLLYEMGLMASLVFIPEHQRNEWSSQEEAFEGQRWMFHGMTGEEEEKVRLYLQENLVQVGNLWKLPYPRKCYWAFMWWKKD